MSSEVGGRGNNNNNNNNRSKAKGTSGWAAFDLKQRQMRKQGFLESDNQEDYPSLLSASPEIFFNKNVEKPPFSSLVVASMNLVDSRNSQPVSNSHLLNNETALDSIQRLKHFHPWADGSLIQDILAAVDNNVDEASSLLGAMLISENKDAESKQVGSDIATFDIQAPASSGEKTNVRFTTDHPFDIESKDKAPSMGATNSLPIEPDPEWEDDDIYLIHRKDAIRMIRSAGRHSKTATDAYLRGDHTSALHFSRKAQEEWTAAEKLNAAAAKEILNVRNSENDLWTLDLHGLHAAEAVVALRERLQTVESPDGVDKELGMFVAASGPSTTHVKVDKFGRQHPPSRLRPTLLEVITGKGNHSRGAAALPSAIRNFLSENRYHFDETRPGVIMIRPKFRQQ